MPIELFYGLGLLLLVGAMAFGVYRSKNRNRANDPVREAATNQLYDDPDGYAEGGGREKLKKQLKPE